MVDQATVKPQTAKRLAAGKALGGRKATTVNEKVSAIEVNFNTIESLYAQGLTDAQVAVVLNVTSQTLTNWKSDPQFFFYLKRGKDISDARVERALYERATGYRTTYMKNIVVSDGKDAGSHIEKVEEELTVPPDTVACIFWLKNRKPAEWRDKTETVHSGNVTFTSIAQEVNNTRLAAPSKN